MFADYINLDITDSTLNNKAINFNAKLEKSQLTDNETYKTYVNNANILLKLMRLESNESVEKTLYDIANTKQEGN